MGYNEIVTTVIGNVISDVTVRTLADSRAVANFRMASSERRFDKETGLWVDGDRLYLSVSCWGWMAHNVHRSLAKGDPVVVTGKVSMREYKTAEGEHRTSLDLTARALGPDLSACSAAVTRSSRDPAVAQGTQLTLGEATVAA